MKFFKLSTLALTISLSFGATMPAKANVYDLLLQKKHHHTHQRHHQNHRYSNSHHRVNYYRHRKNRRIRNNSSRKRVRVFNPHRRYGTLRHRH